MSTEIKKEIQLEIAHVLFIDIVGYSKLSINEQRAAVDQLTQIVRATEQFQKAGASERLIKIATGDGMALVFYTSPEAPVRCAVELSRALKDHPQLRLRMGIHSGPVSGVVDVTDRTNLAGAGLNLARRVMDCADAGHILLSKHVAEDLAEFEEWRPFLHDLGACEVKHGVQLGVVNLCSDDVGNSQLPQKFQALRKRRVRVRWTEVAAGLLLLAAIAAAFVFVSKRSATSISIAPEKSIAVLPFENLSRDPDNAFFADGVQDEILADLAKVADLKVISRTSVMLYKSGNPRNLREIGQQLGVAHVLEGSVQRAANRVRVTAQLIDARTDDHLWAQTYDRDLADVFAIQSEIAEKIAEQLRAHLSPSEHAAISQAPTSDLVANDLYERARVLVDQGNADPGDKESFLQAISLLEEAVRRDPNFLLAYCLLCEANLNLYWQGFDHTPQRRERANAALRQAERIQPDAGEVHMQKGRYAYYGFRDYERMRTEFELARRTLPNDARLYLYLGSVDRRQGRWEDAVRDFHRATELDPRNVLILEEAGWTFTALHRYAEATSLMERAFALGSKNVFVRAILSQLPYFARADTGPWRSHLNAILDEGKEAASRAAFAFIDCALAERDRKMAAQALTIIPAEGAQNPADSSLWPRDWYVGLVARSFGDSSGAQSAFTTARDVAAKAVQGQPEYAPAWSLLGMIDAGLGRKTEAIAEGKRACQLLPISRDAVDGPFYVTNLALIYAWVGEKDFALEQLAISAKIPAGVTYGELKLSPIWDPLRSDPRFEKIVASLAPK
jgi:TolB-like protein/class 3 adenylate cyclase/Flp pilus assembly protein TadD